MNRLSTDKDINKLCNRLLESKRWEMYRHGKHAVLRHYTGKTLIVPSTPSDCKAFANFKRDYKNLLREILFCAGIIL